ncbi:MAG: hypothetical protein WC848_02705 [Parcubacteria group bacterium]|jgi:hypothetical protein
MNIGAVTVGLFVLAVGFLIVPLLKKAWKDFYYEEDGDFPVSDDINARITEMDWQR